MDERDREAFDFQWGDFLSEWEGGKDPAECILQVINSLLSASLANLHLLLARPSAFISVFFIHCFPSSLGVLLAQQLQLNLAKNLGCECKERLQDWQSCSVSLFISFPNPGPVLGSGQSTDLFW